MPVCSRNGHLYTRPPAARRRLTLARDAPRCRRSTVLFSASASKAAVSAPSPPLGPPWGWLCAISSTPTPIIRVRLRLGFGSLQRAASVTAQR